GGQIQLRGWLRTEDVNGWVGLWVRQDAGTQTINIDNMQAQQVAGTRDWRQYQATIPVASEANRIVFGVLLVGTGRIWADDLELLVDGTPIWEAKPGALELDHQFDNGSGIHLERLSETQIDNLALLGRVWGFLKYHHPRVTAGEKHWDYELLR